MTVAMNTRLATPGQGLFVTTPLRKARGILRKSGREAAVAYLSHEVKEMAEVSDEMATGIASDALDGDESILQDILQLSRGLSPDGKAEAMQMIAPGINDTMLEPHSALPSTWQEGGGEFPPSGKETTTQGNPGVEELPSQDMAGQNTDTAQPAPEAAAGHRDLFESPEEPAQPVRKGNGSVAQPANNLNPAHGDSSAPKHIPGSKPNTIVPERPVSLGAPVVGQLERAPKLSEGGNQEAPKPAPGDPASDPIPAGSDTKPSKEKWQRRLTKSRDWQAALKAAGATRGMTQSEAIPVEPNPSEAGNMAKTNKWQARLAKNAARGQFPPEAGMDRSRPNRWSEQRNAIAKLIAAKRLLEDES